MRALRLAGLLAAAFLVEWWWGSYLSLGGVAPDWLFIATVALAGLYGPIPGQVFGFLWGLALDTLTVRLFGGHALMFSFVGYAVGRSRRQMDLSSPPSQVVMVAFLTVGYALALGLLGRLIDGSFLWPGWKIFIFTPLLNAVAAPFVFAAVEKALK